MPNAVEMKPKPRCSSSEIASVKLSEEHRRRTSEALPQEPIVAVPFTQATERISHAPRKASTITATLVALWVIVLVGMIGWALFS